MDRRTFLLVPLVPVLGACEAVQQREQGSRLDGSLKAYAGSVRWGNLDTAYGFLRPRAGVLQPPPALDSLKVTGYEINIGGMNATKDEATVTMTFAYYFLDQGRVSSTTRTSVWYYVPEGRSWVMDATSLPDFRR